ISAPGKYVVTRDLFGCGYWGIIVNADNVSLDLNGHSICCASYGVIAVGGRKNIRVTNGTMNACDFGVCFIDNAKVQVDHVICVADIWGIWANSNEGVFVNNEIVNMRSIGIAGNGDRNRISANKITTQGDGIAATGVGNFIIDND